MWTTWYWGNSNLGNKYVVSDSNLAGDDEPPAAAQDEWNVFDLKKIKMLLEYLLLVGLLSDG